MLCRRFHRRYNSNFTSRNEIYLLVTHIKFCTFPSVEKIFQLTLVPPILFVIHAQPHNVYNLALSTHKQTLFEDTLMEASLFQVLSFSVEYQQQPECSTPYKLRFEATNNDFPSLTDSAKHSHCSLCTSFSNRLSRKRQSRSPVFSFCVTRNHIKLLITEQWVKNFSFDFVHPISNKTNLQHFNSSVSNDLSWETTSSLQGHFSFWQILTKPIFVYVSAN